MKDVKMSALTTERKPWVPQVREANLVGLFRLTLDALLWTIARHTSLLGLGRARLQAPEVSPLASCKVNKFSKELQTQDIKMTSVSEP